MKMTTCIHRRRVHAAAAAARTCNRSPIKRRQLWTLAAVRCRSGGGSLLGRLGRVRRVENSRTGAALPVRVPGSDRWNFFCAMMDVCE